MTSLVQGSVKVRLDAQVMLSIGKLAAGQQEYYLQSVAAGTPDYYVAGGDAPGRWIGAGSARLGLREQVTRAALTDVLDGRHPSQGRPLTRSRKGRRSIGWDLTFSAPKSVSLLYGLGDAPTRHVVMTAHDQAVEAAFAYLEREAGFVRRGDGGTGRETGAGLVGAAFRHRTSRAGDPQLHTHVLLANLVATTDGEWRAVHSKAFYQHARAAGGLYRAALRDALTRQLGVSWRPRPRGLHEVARIPDRVLRAFSQRRVEIESSLAERGASSARAAGVATLATRRAKPDRPVPDDELHGHWRGRAAALGFGDAQVAQLFAVPRLEDDSRHLVKGLAKGAVVAAERHPRERELLRVLLGPEGLTAQVSAFRRRDVVRAVSDLLPEVHDQVTVGYAAWAAGGVMMSSNSTGVNRPSAACRRRRW